jgi:hypothetical protein
MRLELLGEVFNLMNHQNITNVSNDAYTLSSTTGTSLTSATGFGTYTNSNSNWAYSSRQMQIAVRLHF